MKNYQHFKVDLTNCDKEPIHIIGRIQPHGFLLVIDQESFLIEQITGNIDQLVPDTVSEDWLKRSIFDFLPTAAKEWFVNRSEERRVGKECRSRRTSVHGL